MDPQEHRSDSPGESSHDNTAPNQPRAAAITPTGLEQHAINDGCINPALLKKKPQTFVTQPVKYQQIPETAPGWSRSPALHSGNQRESTSVLSQDLFPRTEAQSTRTMHEPPDAALDSALSESAIRTTVATAPQADESTLNESDREDQIVRRHGCLINNSTFIVTFDVNQLPTELAVRFLRRSKLGQPHKYANPTHFDVGVLVGLATQLVRYWSPGTDAWERVRGPFSVFFEDRMDKSVRNAECAHCIWLRVQGLETAPCSWQDWNNKTYIEACQRCVADGRFCLVSDYGKSTNLITKSDLPMILPMPVEWHAAGEQVFRVPRQLEFWVNKSRHETDSEAVIKERRRRRSRRLVNDSA